ncbi:hypothetical protein H5410_021146 [Solanum commersonii]|uniref:Uncharacterized protein n=1 Tax=Solanum commersonii TaxID=4109 RepID=A0A9J5ZAI1_SOLCO|nr:hypothetical protein H5410_021146 [Solanum commersonii]
MVDAFVSFAVQKLGDFLIQQVSLRTSLREKVEWLRNELLFIQSFLKDAELKQCGDQRVQQWVFEINSIANDVVAILETYNFEAGKVDDDGFVSCLKACACICRKETKFYNDVVQTLLADFSKKSLVKASSPFMREAWESLKRAFPDSKNGSKFIITTRKEDVAERVDDREDKVVYAENIIWLWMDEGFIPRGEERIEDVVEVFLNELIRRSLIQVVDTVWEKVTECRVHDLLRDLAIPKALEVNFFDIYDPRSHSVSSLYIRHAIHSQGERKLYHLKFLRLRGIRNLPSSIGNLKNLQTLVVNEGRFSCELPPETADLINLRHLDSLYSKPLKHLSKLTSLQVLKGVRYDQWKDVEPVDLVNLRELTMHDITKTYSLNNISNLKYLSTIKLFCEGYESFPSLEFLNCCEKLQKLWLKGRIEFQIPSP